MANEIETQEFTEEEVVSLDDFLSEVVEEKEEPAKKEEEKPDKTAEAITELTKEIRQDRQAKPEKVVKEDDLIEPDARYYQKKYDAAYKRLVKRHGDVEDEETLKEWAHDDAMEKLEEHRERQQEEFRRGPMAGPIEEIASKLPPLEAKWVREDPRFQRVFSSIFQMDTDNVIEPEKPKDRTARARTGRGGSGYRVSTPEGTADFHPDEVAYFRENNFSKKMISTYAASKARNARRK